MSLRNLPSVDEILNDPVINDLGKDYARHIIVAKVREVLTNTRLGIMKQDTGATREEMRAQVVAEVFARLKELASGSLRRVINATGVVLHTNLGRAILSPAVVEHMASLAGCYNNLEFNLESGTRGSRYSHVESLLTSLIGCESALVVNNNAAAVLLALNTLAAGKEVIVSRGQLVEIGGSFRIPEIMKMSGCRLVEVGTTNKTHLSDFEQAINENTGLLLSVHTSNYRILGFTHTVSLDEMVQLGRKHNIPVMHDLGSGSMVDLSPWGLDPEPTVQESVAAGLHIVTFSGDKLLGGPQAGIIAGRKDHVDMMKKNQLLRALRVDKLTIAALEAAMISYMTSDPTKTVPILSMITKSAGDLKLAADRLADLITAEISHLKPVAAVKTVEITDTVGGGAYPLQELPGYAVEIVTAQSPEGISARLRTLNPAAVVRIQDDTLLLSVRTLLPGDDKVLAKLIYQSLEDSKK